MPADALHPRKQPRQARAAETVEIILEAATRVLASKSLPGFNTNRVAEVAGISIGSLYQYFPNKSALVAALIAREQKALADAIERSLDADPDRPLDLLLSDLVDIAIEHQFGNAVYAAAIDREETRLPVDDILVATQLRIIHAVDRMLDTHRSVIAPNLPSTAAADCLTITKALIEADPQCSKCDLPVLRQRVLRALHGYLQYDT